MLGLKRFHMLVAQKMWLEFFFFPDFFYGWMEGGGRGEGTWQQMSPSIVWETVEGSADPEGKGFCSRASAGQDCLEMLQWI